MVIAGRRKSIAFFIALGAGLISVILLLYIGWVLLNWRTGILLFLGILLLAMIIAGIVVNTTFLVREIRRNEQHDAFINAVTHELKTPVASIRLYLETLQTRTLDDAKRREFYGIMLEDSDRLLAPSSRSCARAAWDRAAASCNVQPLDLNGVIEECVGRARTLHHRSPETLQYDGTADATIMGDADEVSAAVSNLIDNAVKYSEANVKVMVEPDKVDNEIRHPSG